MKASSKTKLKHLKTMSDEEISFNEIPELGDDFFKNAELIMPSKESVTMRMDTDVLAWFRQTGKGYQTRINQLLRRYMEAQMRR